jgi:glutamyl-tRNA synthetase
MVSHNTLVRVRFAPSPTGHLHIGGLRTALFNWLFARHHNGEFFLRVEDTDVARSRQEYQQSQLASLAWASIDYDGPLVIQSERIEQHRAVAQQLLEHGHAYRCYCPAYKEDGDTDQGYYRYDKKCRSLSSEQQDLSKPHSIRFKVPDQQEAVTFEDIIRGTITIEPDQLDDFIIVRSDGTPMYNFVVVVDDAFMKITHVIRGEEHISNTPKQILLYTACGYQLPHFAHLPMILGPDGAKLSKRNAATSVLEYKREGYLPDALCNYLARLGWSHGDQEIFTQQELITYFSLDQVGKKGAIFDPQKLAWMNSVYLRHRSACDILMIMQRDVNVTLHEQLPLWSEKQVITLIDLYKERVKTIAELVQELQALYAGPTGYDASSIAASVTPTTRAHLEQLIPLLESTQVDVFTHDHLATLIKNLCKQLSIKLVALAQPIRIALTGISASPGVFELLAILGKQESIRRLQKFLATL